MIDPAPLDCLRSACDGLGRLGVAVSGGGDSVAALVLAVEALGTGRVAAVTVDHGLRPEAAAEAAQVGALCDMLGVSHSVLRWTDRGHGNLQDAARRARHRLIGDWALDRVDAVVLGHTLDDQAETFLMRLARGSGVDGLAAMSPRQVINGTVWLRPLLGIRRETLRDELRARSIGWVEDPTNDDAAYQRVKARHILQQLTGLGIDAEGLARTATRMRRARAVLEQQALAVFGTHVHEERGILRLDRAILDALPELRDRVFAAVLKVMSGSDYPPRLEALQRWIGARHGALMGCALREAEDGTLLLYREASAVRGIEASCGVIWDRRWTATGPGGAVIRAMGDAGLCQLSAQAARGVHPHWRETGLPRAVLEGLPGLWRDDDLTAAPLAFWPQGWQLHARPVAAMLATESQSH